MDLWLLCCFSKIPQAMRSLYFFVKSAANTHRPVELPRIDWNFRRAVILTYQVNIRCCVTPTIFFPSDSTHVCGRQVDDDEVEVGRASEEPLTLFVKNVSFSTKEPALRACFERAGLRVRSVSIPRKKGKGASEAMLSTGIAFVECADASLVDKALKVGCRCIALVLFAVARSVFI